MEFVRLATYFQTESGERDASQGQGGEGIRTGFGTDSSDLSSRAVAHRLGKGSEIDSSLQ
jgi:hypothetical protein